MSLENMNSFLIALEAVKGYYTCRVCKEFCRKPVTLKCCFHLICEEHIAELIKCPNCDKALLDQPVFKVDNLETSVNSTFELEKIFSKYKNQPNPNEARDKNVTIRGTRNTKKQTTNNINPELRQSMEETSKISQQSTVNIKNRKDRDKRNKNGETALHVSCRHGNIKKIQELLNLGASSNTKDYAGWTPLHEAVQTNRPDIVRLLLNNNTLINVPGPDNETPLHEAVKYNHKEIVNELVIYGADVNAKNSKGETPEQLANTEIKKIIDVAMKNVKINITNLSTIEMELDYEDIIVYCVTKYRTVQNKLKILSKHHNITIESKFCKKVTHLIVDAEEGICMSSLDILQGIVYGIWILSSDWIIHSTDNKLEDYEKYEIKIGTAKYNGAKISRYNKNKQLPHLFNGCHFYLHNFNTSYELSKNLIINKTVLTKLITDAGGKVLRRLPNPESIPDNEKLVPYHGKKGGKLDLCSHYIIFKDVYEPKYNMKHLKALPIAWLLECIEKYELCEPE